MCHDRFRYTLRGTDCVLGARFRVGTFRSFVSESVDTLCNRRVDAAKIFGASIAKLHPGQAAGEDLEERAKALDDFLQTLAPTLHEGANLVSDCVAHIEANADCLRGQQVAHFANLSVRSLQRLFKDLVGVSPNWVIRRFRLQALIEALENSEQFDLAALSIDLGYLGSSPSHPRLSRHHGGNPQSVC